MDWHWTWQDPVALALALAGIGLALWLRRRFGGGHDCAACPAHDAKTPPGPGAPVGGREGGARRVSLSETRLGRRGDGAGPPPLAQGQGVRGR